MNPTNVFYFQDVMHLSVDPDTVRSLRPLIRMDLSPYCEGGSMIPLNLLANCEGWIYDPNKSGILILEIRSQDPLSETTPMSARQVWRGADLCKST